MKKTTPAFFTLCLSTLLMAADGQIKKNPTNTKPFAILTLIGSNDQKTLTCGESEELLNSLTKNLEASGQTLTEEKRTAVEQMIREYMIADKALLMVANASDVKNSPQVKEQIQKASEKIIKDAYKDSEMKKLQADDSEAMYKEITSAVIAEKGDQVTLSVLPLVQKTDAPRIIKKMSTITNPEAKSKEWAKITKNLSSSKPKTIGPVLLSEIPESLQKNLVNCKTGDTIEFSVADPKNPKNVQITLFFVMKREKITGDLLKQAMISKIDETLEKQFNEHIKSKVKIEKLEEKNQEKK